MALPLMGGVEPGGEPPEGVSTEDVERAVNPVVQQMKNLEKIAETIKSDLEGDTDLLDANLVNVPLFRGMNEKVVMELGQLQSIQEGLSARLASGEFSSKEERDALIKTANDLSKTQKSLDDFVKNSGKNSPIIKEMTKGLEDFYDTLQIMADTAEYREVVAAKIDDMSWGQLKEEIRINKEEMRILDEKQKELDMQRAWFESNKASMEQTEQIEAMKELVKAQKDLESSKERVKGRGAKLEEKRKEGVFGKFLKGLRESFDKLAEGLRNASKSWITKVFGALLILGLLIKKGIISPKTIAKVLGFIVKFLIEGVKMAIGLIFTGLMGIVETIWELFKGGDYLAGFILALGTAIFALVVLGKVITIATGIWTAMVGGLQALQTSFGLISNLFNSDFIKHMKGNLLGGVKNMFGGLTDSLKGYFGKFMPKKEGGGGGVPGLGGSKESKNFLGGLGDTLKNLGTTEALKGALVIGILATSIFIVAKAFEAFSKVSWGGVAKGFVSLLALVGIAKFVEQMKNDIIQGAAAIALLGVAMLTLGYGLAKFTEVGVADILKGLAALTALIFLARLVKEQSAAILQGAAAIALLGVAMIPLAFGLSLLKGVGIAQIIGFAVAVGILTGIAALAGGSFPLIAAGAGALAILGAAMIPMALGMMMLSGIDPLAVAAFALAVSLLTGVAILAGLAFVPILIGTAALAILSAGIAVSIYMISTALKAAAGIDLAVVGLLAEAIGILGFTVIKLVPFLPLILLGSLALGALGLAVLPFAFAMQALNGVVIDLVQIANLDEAIRILAWRAVKEAAFAPVILVGALAIGALGLAVLPFAYAMQALNGVVIDLVQITNLDEAIRILAWRAVKEAAFIGPIALGSLALYILGNAIQSFLPFLQFLSGADIDMGKIIALSIGIGLLTAITTFAGLAFVPIALGSLSLLLMGGAIQSFIPILESVANVGGENMLSFATSVGILVATFTAAGLLFPLIVLGSFAISSIAKSLIPMAKALSTLGSADIDIEKIMLFSEAIKILARRAADPLGISQPKQKASGFLGFLSNVASGVGDMITGSLDAGKILTGANAIREVGNGLIPFARALQILSTAQIDGNTIMALSWAIKLISHSAAFVSKFANEVKVGSMVLSWLAYPIGVISLALQNLYGIDAKVVEAFGTAVEKLVYATSYAGLNYGNMILGTSSLLFMSFSLVPMVRNFQALGEVDPKTFMNFSMSIGSLVSTALFAGRNAMMVSLGSLVILFLGENLRNFGNLFNQMKLDSSSVNSFVYGVNSLLRSAIFAGKNFISILLGSIALYILGKSIRDIAESLSHIKGLKNEDVNSFIYGLDMLINYFKNLGFFEGMYLAHSINSISDELKILGESLLPLSKAFSNIKGFDANVLWDIANAMDYFVYSMLNLEFVDPYLFTDIFQEMMSITPELNQFAEVLKMFSGAMEKTNVELQKFSFLFSGLYNVADPIYELSDSLLHLAGSIREIGSSVSNMTDEEFLRVVRVASLIAKSERSAVGRTETTISDQMSAGETTRAGYSINGREDISPRAREIRERVMRDTMGPMIHASEILKRGGMSVSPEQIEGVRTRANIPVSAKINGKEISLDKLHTEEERNKIAAATKMAEAMKMGPTTNRGRISSSGAGPVGVPDSLGAYKAGISGEVESVVGTKEPTGISASRNIMQNGSGRVFEEIKDILRETRDLLAESIEKAGNAVIMQTQNTTVSNNNSTSGPIVRPMSTNDQYYSKLRFRHHI
jgi:hypothetical protein